jgi:hypothetical protein
MTLLRLTVLALMPHPLLKDHPISILSGVTLIDGGRPSIHNPRTRHAVVTKDEPKVENLLTSEVDF